MTTGFVLLILILLCATAFYALKKAHSHNKLSLFTQQLWVDYCFDEDTFHTKLNALMHQHRAIDQMPSGFEKYQRRQAVMKEIEMLIAAHPKLKENLQDNIVYFRQSNS